MGKIEDETSCVPSHRSKCGYWAGWNMHLEFGSAYKWCGDSAPEFKNVQILAGPFSSEKKALKAGDKIHWGA